MGYSIPFQRAKLEQYASEHSLEIVARFEDVQTAKQPGRPGFESLVRFLEEHPAVGTVLVHRVDRLMRNHLEYGVVVEQLGAAVRSVVEPAENNAAGRMQQGMSVVVAKYHSDNLSQEVKKGLRAKFESGGLVTRAPVGYRNISRTRTAKATVVVDPDRAPVIRRAFERYATGQVSCHALALDLYDHGLRTRLGKPYSDERTRWILRNPFYTGLTSYQGESRPGLHPAIVPERLWRRVKKVLELRAQDHGEKGSKFFLLRGFLYCGACQRRMTAEDHPKGSYYRCMKDAFGRRCGSRYVPLRDLDADVEALLPTIALTEQGKAGVLAALRTLESERERDRHAEERSLRARKEQLQGKLLRLSDGYAAGDIPKDEYLALRRGYDSDLGTANDRLDFLTGDLSADVRALETVLETATAIAMFYALCQSPTEKKSLLRKLFARIEVTDRAITRIEYHPPFHLLLGDTGVQAGSEKGLPRALLAHIASNRSITSPEM